jgi:hypothetical protein
VLWKAAGESGGEQALRLPRDGVLIGGTQSVVLPDQGAPTPAKRASADGGCSVARGGAAPAWAWPLAIVLLVLRRRAAPMCALLLLLGCEVSKGSPAQVDDAGSSNLPHALSGEQLRDPETCKGCHPTHYREWSSSMHAYAAQDPVFVAMNKRGQRETDGELGDFCIKCHAPMAVIDKTSADGLNLDQLPDRDRGVSCFFCHNTDGLDGDHNAKLHLAGDDTLRGPIEDPRAPGAHRAAYSELFEDTSPKSSALCGGCHDIVTQNGVHLERTFAEYQSGIFSKSSTGEPPAFDSCVGCHMPGQQSFAAVAPSGAPMRTVHEHLWPGVDVALTKFPNRAALRSAVADCQLGPSVSFFTLEVTPPDLFTFQLETNAGHNQPSGASQDRRMWLEFSAYDEAGKLLEGSSGIIADGEIEERPKHDPQLVMFRDRIFDAQGKPVHMFWQAAPSDAHPEGYESSVLPVSTTTYIEGKHAVVEQYRASGPNGLPARVTARLRMRPIGMDVLHDLVESGDLDAKIADEMPTFTFGARIEWTPENGTMKSIAAQLTPADCNTYRCELDPNAPNCN